MVLPAQFQLGLELTNIVNPLCQAVSALGSLAVIDAIKKSGSDFVTETKLANLIGRHRIDPIINFHFKELVSKSDQSMISRYLDIVLEAGSGPTVQEALKNPALFSMVIQLSGLAFAHENESLANTIIEAIEKIVQESGREVNIVPDFVSLLGTLRACQQQTAAFRWALLYEAVEEKIRKAWANAERYGSKERRTEYPEREIDQVDIDSQSRALPVPVMQGLFMWLQSLQSFPEHRLLHLRCNTGMSTVIVWCHHILGLSLVVNIRRTQLCFGDAPYNLIMDHSFNQKASVSLMDPLDPQEPLFTLHNDEHSIGTNYDHRVEACGYGLRILRSEGVPEREREALARSVISYSIEECEAFDDFRKNTHNFGPSYPSRDRIVNSGRFLFAFDESTTFNRHEAPMVSRSIKRQALLALVVIVVTFARISEDDLARCKDVPLALNVLTSFPINRISIFQDRDDRKYLDLLQSFETLSLLLLGRHWYHDYGKPSVLLSAWGWSVFLDSIDAVDPFDVSVNTLRFLRGVPSRRGFRRNRIIDGPRGATLLVTPHASYISERNERFYGRDIDIFRAQKLSTAERGVILVGHHSDAFQISQQFTHHDEHNPQYAFGFREMTEWSIQSHRIPRCQCHQNEGKGPSPFKLEFFNKLLGEKYGLRIVQTGDQKNSSTCYAFRDDNMCLYNVSNNPAARWLQLGVMYRSQTENPTCSYTCLRGYDTCIDCAIRNSEVMPPYGFVLL